MSQKIAWNTNVFPHLNNAWKKAAANAETARFLSVLEEQALTESVESAPLVKTSTGPILPELAKQLDDASRERLIGYLAQAGIQELSADYRNLKINARFSPVILDVFASSVFALIDCLETLDSFDQGNERIVSLRMEMPAGAQKYFPSVMEHLLMMYPWLRIEQHSTGEQTVHLVMQSDKLSA